MVSGQLTTTGDRARPGTSLLDRGEVRRTTTYLGLALVVALAGALPGRALPPRDPGPFYPLVLGHVGQPYADALPAGATYLLQAGRLQAGLTLEADGRLHGVPSEAGAFRAELAAEEAGGARYPVRLALTVFQADESDRPPAAARFDRRGPFRATVETVLVDLDSSFDGVRVRTAARLALPQGPGPFPLLLFHRGRGFDHDSYTELHERIASYGIAVASIEDRLSFTGATFRAQNPQYDLYRAELGMLSASAVVEGVADHLLARAADPADPLFGQLDPAELFFAGHSRGGGAVHASHQRSLRLRLKGLIYLMAFDLRYFQECAPPAVAPAYPIFSDHPRTPCLVIAAENDGDLTYPIADQLIDRATGPATQVTLYGGVHNLISDAHPAEGNARIGRDEEQSQTVDWIVCFVKRWAEDDLTCDARLYGPAHQGDAAAAVSWWRPSARTLLVEDAQDGDADRNLRGPNLVAQLRRSEESLYPDVGDLPSLGIRHTLLTPAANTSVWRMALDQPLDVSGHRNLVLRAAQTSSAGWGWAEVWVRLLDATGAVAWTRVWEPAAGGPFPSPAAGAPHDRLLEVSLPLDGFFVPRGGAALDATRLAAVDLFLVVRDPRQARSVAVDQVRFE